MYVGQDGCQPCYNLEEKNHNRHIYLQLPKHSNDTVFNISQPFHNHLHSHILYHLQILNTMYIMLQEVSSHRS